MNEHYSPDPGPWTLTVPGLQVGECERRAIELRGSCQQGEKYNDFTAGKWWLFGFGIVLGSVFLFALWKRI